MRIYLVSYSVEACHKYCGISVIRVAGSIGIPKLKSLCFGGFGISGYAHNGAPVCHGIAYGDGRFKARDKAAERICGGVGYAADGAGMGQ